MASAYFSTNTELGLINALTQSLTVYLPQNSVQGKSLFIKDAAGTSLFSTITVQTQGSDTFEDGSTKQFLNSAYESMQLVYNAQKWYITGGTMFNTMTISTLRTQAVSTNTISSLTASFSTLRFSDQLLTSTSGNLNTVSSFLYFNSNIVNGGIRTAIPQTLNSLRFSVYSVPGLIAWFDGTDPLGTGTPPTNGTSISTWVDKSRNGFNATQGTLANQPVYNSAGYLTFNGTNQNLLLPNPGALVANTFFSIFVVEQRGVATPPARYFLQGNVSAALSQLHIGYYGYNNSFNFNFYNFDLVVINASLMPNYVPGNEPYRIWSYVYGSQGRRIYINGLLSGSDTNSLNLINSAGLAIGGNGTYYQGNMNEMIFYKPFIDGFQRQQIEGYLAWKWGLQGNLPANHPFKNAPPQ
jgi:hypothetical protein